MKAADICRIFHACLGNAFRTRLEGGADEPFYQPAEGGGDWHRMIFREDFAASALHEISHWCSVGSARRLQPDLGYWYRSNRDVSAQRAFESLEARPQALEWIFSVAADVPFRVSCDNFDPQVLELNGFRHMVRDAAIEWLDCELPARAKTFTDALSRETGVIGALDPETYRELPR